MRAIAAAALLLIAAALAIYWQWSASMPEPPVTSDPTYRQGSYAIQLSRRPCPFDEVKQALEEEGIPPARWAIISEGARTRTACWVMIGTEDVLTQDQDGHGGSLPLEWFKAKPQV